MICAGVVRSSGSRDVSLQRPIPHLQASPPSMTKPASRNARETQLDENRISIAAPGQLPTVISAHVDHICHNDKLVPFVFKKAGRNSGVVRPGRVGSDRFQQVSWLDRDR
jgi:hypothetical protein